MYIFCSGNIPENDVSKGVEICDYLQPFPPRGLGYCRYIFVLYRQEKVIDFSDFKRSPNTKNLTERTFSTLDFYRQLQDVMTPCGLAFFQSNWDGSVTSFFHNVLGKCFVLKRASREIVSYSLSWHNIK